MQRRREAKHLEPKSVQLTRHYRSKKRLTRENETCRVPNWTEANGQIPLGFRRIGSVVVEGVHEKSEVSWMNEVRYGLTGATGSEEVSVREGKVSYLRLSGISEVTS
jgi:hypothetical protein